MSTIFELKSERPLGPPRDQAEADTHRRAECAERISRLLSAMDGGPYLDPGKAGNLPKTVIRDRQTNPDSETSRRSLLMDRTGLIGEFASREDALQYRNDLQHLSASIIGVENRPLEPRAVREEPITQPAGITGGFNSPNRSTTQELEMPKDLGDSPSTLIRNSPPIAANSLFWETLERKSRTWLALAF